MRQIVLDTETTGLDPESGDRIVEIGCLELINHMPTDRHFHTYVNPERSIPAGATQVSGITDEMLVGKPRFGDVADEFLAFVADSELIIHNAAFDLKFLNSELKRLGPERILDERAFCTLTFARRKFPGSPASLDALCKRFSIDLSARTKHGALIDARLLADVYLELIGGRQPTLLLASGDGPIAAQEEVQIVVQRPRPAPLAPRVSESELAAHAAFVAAELGPNPLWVRIAA
jgi:DNA polymerase-3 subunit epsilon